MIELEEVDDEYDRETRPLLIVLSGPSGVGKDATLQMMQEMGCPFHFVVTATTRPRREGEVHGKDYFFLSFSEFADMLEKGELLEHAIVYGDYKGIPKQQVREALASGKDVVMRIDVQGAATIRRIVHDAIFIFIAAETEDALVMRLRERKTEAADQLKIRIATAREEMKRIDEFDYVVVNHAEHLEQTVQQIMCIIQAEKCKVHQRQVRL
ncbi:MAG: guanylate kinase [Ardenticatenales bacterium]|nr:guanylate kinase [Ardenticatenales bacterium]